MKHIKKLLLTLSFSLLVFHLSAQRIHFCDSTNKWVTKGYDSSLGEEVTSFYYYPPGGGQWLPDGYYYLTLYDSVVFGFGPGTLYETSVREDTDVGIVYFSYAPWDASSQLYVYNLNAGDTVNYSSLYYFSGSETNPIIDSVIAVDSVLIGSLYYKRITLLEIDTYWYYAHTNSRLYTYVEGIGSLSGPLEFLGNPYYETLTCFSNKGVEPITDIAYPNPFALPFPTFTDTVYFTNDCITVAIPTVKPLSNEQSIKVVPNPANEYTKLVFSQTIISGMVSIYNNMGQTIATILIHSQQDVPIGSMLRNPGMYFYKVTDEEKGNVMCGKVVRNE